MAPFFANFGYHPAMQFRLPREIGAACVRLEQNANSFAERLREEHEQLCEIRLISQDRQTRHAGSKGMKFNVGNMV